ncbi:MAG: phosphoribosylformylglycinamidine synthase, partial [Gemmatimonadota bacterium]|nr:phosphoribosylformylglycinamidine synthase [Gemmatimonadota bacterium]
MSLLHRYRHPGFTDARRHALLQTLHHRVGRQIRTLDTEFCFNIEVTPPLTAGEERTLAWLLTETFEPEGYGDRSFLDGKGLVVEVGPRMSFTTAWSTNAAAICHACGLTNVRRIERSRRFLLTTDGRLDDDDVAAFLPLVHDRMTECRYPEPLDSFETGVVPELVFTVPLLANGRAALERINREMGLAFDEWDLDYYTDLFVNRIGRDPTNVECFDIAQSNSEHSRHWFFRGRLVVDGQEIPDHLIALVKGTLDANPGNSVIAFK